MMKFSYIATGVLAAAVIGLGAGCSKKAVDVTEPATQESPQTTAPETETDPLEETTVQETEVQQETKAQQENRYHLLQGTVSALSKDGSQFTLKADNGETYDIRLSQIRDMEVEIAADVQIAIAYVGKPQGELEDVVLVVALPEQEEWTIITEKGTTISNAMSTFSMETEDGQEIGFMKDNCPMEDGSLTSDSGDKIEVTYINSMGINFPLEIKKAD